MIYAVVVFTNVSRALGLSQFLVPNINLNEASVSMYSEIQNRITPLHHTKVFGHTVFVRTKFASAPFTLRSRALISSY